MERGPASAPSNSVTPYTVPGAPTAPVATVIPGTVNDAANGRVTVTFTAPASNGGRPITRYTVNASSGGITATGAGTSITVTGLTNGTAYTFTVRATNAAGQGLPRPPPTASPPTPSPARRRPSRPWQATPRRRSASRRPPPTAAVAITLYTVYASSGGITATGAGNLHHGHGPDQRHGLYLHGQGHELGRPGPCLGRLQQRHAWPDPAARRADGSHGSQGERTGSGELQPARLQRRQSHHPLHRVRQLRRHHRHRRREPHHGQRADQRDSLYLHRERDERRRARAQLRLRPTASRRRQASRWLRPT